MKTEQLLKALEKRRSELRKIIGEARAELAALGDGRERIRGTTVQIGVADALRDALRAAESMSRREMRRSLPGYTTRQIYSSISGLIVSGQVEQVPGMIPRRYRLIGERAK